MNPMNMIRGFIEKNMNPEQILTRTLGNSNNPMLNNLVDMAKKGNTQGVENFARNLFKEQGKDFDKEFGEFMQSIRPNK